MITQKIAIAGSSGRMGRTLLEAVAQAPDMQLAAALERIGSPYLNKDAGELIGTNCGTPITSDFATALKESDQLIDFTRPEGTLAHLAVCRETGVKMIIGTTGFSAQEKAQLQAAARDIAIVFAPNMSVGVNLLAALVEQASKRLGHDFDIEISEIHHRNKVDAPSGTALMLGKATGRTAAPMDRSGKRETGTLGYAVQRGGDVIGEHTVTFFGIGERIELGHRAHDRSLFAKGALRAVTWLKDKPHGFYTMRDVLDL